jgi:hypothetical protein
MGFENGLHVVFRMQELCLQERRGLYDIVRFPRGRQEKDRIARAQGRGREWLSIPNQVKGRLPRMRSGSASRCQELAL